MQININYPAIFVSMLLNFLLGFVWYTPLFGKIWAREMGMSAGDNPDKSLMIRGMVFMLIGNFLFAWVLAHNIAAWEFVPGAKEMGPVRSALSSAIFTWLGFYFPVDLGSTSWEKKSWTLFGINTGYHLASLLLVAFLLTHWK